MTKILRTIKAILIVIGIIAVGVVLFLTFKKAPDNKAVEAVKKASDNLRSKLKDELEKVSPADSVDNLDNANDVRAGIDAGINRSRNRLLGILRRFTEAG